MKAYKIKVIVKNSKPAVWWRIIIPAGITYSTLAVILSDIVPEEAGKNFTFEYYQKRVIFESTAKKPLESYSWMYDAVEACKTFIDDFFDDMQNMSFKVNNADLRIETEEILSDCLLKYPEEIKHSKAVTDDRVKNTLETSYTVSEGEPEFKKYTSLINAKKKGVLNLKCSQNPVSDKNNTEYSMHNILNKKLSNGFLNSVSEISLSQYLEKIPLVHLKNTANALNITNYEKLNEEELSGKIWYYILNEDNFYRLFLNFNDIEIESFERVLNSSYYIRSKEDDDFSNLMFLRLVIVFENERVIVPSEVAELYKKINTEEFQTERKKVRWIIDILSLIIRPYYGYIPKEKFCLLCRRKTTPVITPSEVMTLYDKILYQLNRCFIRDDLIVSKDLEKDELFQYVKNLHGDKPYYIMSENEIEDIINYGYPLLNSHYKKLKSFFVQYWHTDIYNIEILLEDVHNTIIFEYGFNDVMKCLNEHGVPQSGVFDTDKFINILQDVYNNTRTYYNCGHTPQEMSKYMRTVKPKNVTVAKNKPVAVLADIKADEEDSRRKKRRKPGKIYPNDPCPCGSGKKYKKCCGRTTSAGEEN